MVRSRRNPRSDSLHQPVKRFHDGCLNRSGQGGPIGGGLPGVGRRRVGLGRRRQTGAAAPPRGRGVVRGRAATGAARIGGVRIRANGIARRVDEMNRKCHGSRAHDDDDLGFDGGCLNETAIFFFFFFRSSSRVLYPLSLVGTFSKSFSRCQRTGLVLSTRESILRGREVVARGI